MVLAAGAPTNVASDEAGGEAAALTVKVLADLSKVTVHADDAKAVLAARALTEVALTEAALAKCARRHALRALIEGLLTVRLLAKPSCCPIAVLNGTVLIGTVSIGLSALAAEALARVALAADALAVMALAVEALAE